MNVSPASSRRMMSPLELRSSRCVMVVVTKLSVARRATRSDISSFGRTRCSPTLLHALPGIGTTVLVDPLHIARFVISTDSELAVTRAVWA
jgi:hypothetical protein